MAEFASKGVAGTGLGLGIAGTALGLLGGSANILGGMVRPYTAAGDCGSIPVSRYELGQATTISEQAGEIALLKSERYTDERLVEVYKDLNKQVNDVKAIIAANKDEQYGINMQQAVLNGTSNTMLNCLQGQINQLMGLTKLIVPNTSICPGWGAVDVTAVKPAAPAAG